MITLARVGDVVKFTFQDNPLYLNNGTIEVPVNSLSLLIDESNIATFKKAASNDIFLSCSLDELGMSKEQLINWYKDNMVDEGITPEEVEDIVESATTNLFGYAEYDSQNTRINFKHDASGSVISSIDASDFVIDGMIDNVEIVTVEGVKYLKITFNTESGKEPILIPLADIFNPDNYYTKTATDALLADKANTATTYTKTEVDSALSGKADTSAVTEAISAATSGKADADDVYTKTETNTLLAAKADTATTYTKTEVDNAISAATSGKVDTDVFDEKERAVSIALNDLEDRKLDASAYTPTDLSNYYTKSETDGEIEEAVSGKADTSAVTEVNNALTAHTANTDIHVTSTDKTNWNSKPNTVSLTQAEYDALTVKDPNTFYVITDAEGVDLDNYYTKTEVDSALSGKADTSAVTQAISAATSGKADSDSVYTKTEIDSALSGKQDTLVSGTNIKTINNTSILGSGNIDIQGGGGKAIEAGRGISITTGETADTVSFSLPISAGTGTNSIIIGAGQTGLLSGSLVHGVGSSSDGVYSNVFGFNCFSNGNYSFLGGEYLNNYIECGVSFCKYNDTTNSPLFSVGNGTADNARHNAFEIRQNGDIYCSDGTNDVKLQDTITATAANTTALGGLKLVKLTQAEYDALVTKDSDTLYVVTDN